MTWCPIMPIRYAKFERIMTALATGWPRSRIIVGMPPDDNSLVFCYGQIWGSEVLMQKCLKTARPFWHIDNGFWRPGRGQAGGYYRFAYCGMTPHFLLDAPGDRFVELEIKLTPWRKTGDHILLALPGLEYGVGINLDMPEWVSYIMRRLPQMTNRKIIVRDRKCGVPLSVHLKNCWAVVTHSSNVAVDAVCAGIPVFVAETSSAVPVGNTLLRHLEEPQMPDRTQWSWSLAYQQFTIDEMRDGTAHSCLQQVQDAEIYDHSA